MKKLTKLGLALAATGMLAAGPATAHHTFVMFDSDTQWLREGVVLQMLVNNPHIEMTFAIQNEEEVWESFWFEGTAATNLVAKGTMDGDTFQPGDRVQFVYCPLRDGRNGGAINWVRHISSVDGREVDTETFHDASDGGCRFTADVQASWERWMEEGITTNTEGAEWDAENLPEEEEEAAPAA